MVKVEKIKSLIRKNGNPFTFIQPFNTPVWFLFRHRITGLCISYDTVLILAEGGNVYDINDASDDIVSLILNNLEYDNKQRHSSSKRKAGFVAK